MRSNTRNDPQGSAERRLLQPPDTGIHILDDGDGRQPIITKFTDPIIDKQKGRQLDHEAAMEAINAVKDNAVRIA